MARKKEERSLVLIQTTQRSYLGYTQEGERFLQVTKAAIIPDTPYTPQGIAFAYFCARARQRLQDYNLSYNAIESTTTDERIDTLVSYYIEMSRITNKGAFGKWTISRLEKMLGRK